MAGALFIGYALNAIDAKHRLSVPADYRETLDARGAARTVLLGPAERARCLVGYDPGRGDRLQEQLESRFAGDYSDARDDFARFAFGPSERATIDDAGRVVLSATLLDLGEFDKLALFIGAGDYFEIWNPRLLLERPGLDARLERIVRRQLAARGEAA